MENKRRAQGGGTIRKRSDGRWEARYTVGINPETGKQVQKSVYGKTQKEVRQKLNRILVDLDEGSYLEPVKDTLGSWLDTWISTYVVHSVKAYTLDSYEGTCNTHIKPALGRIKLASLSASQIQAFYNSLLTEKGLSPKTVKNVHGILHRALGQAVKLGMLRLNPSDICDLPKSHGKEITPMEQPEIAAFLKAVEGNKYELVYLVTLFTGLRQGEILGLTWDCVNFERNTLYINKQLQKTKKVGGVYVLVPTKNSRNRSITVAPSVMAFLKKQKNQQLQMQRLAEDAWKNEWNLVFTNEFGGHYVHFTVYKHFKEIVRSMGLEEERFHDLRHSFAVISIESGDDIKTLQGNLGHATASFTLDVYGHVSQRMKARSADRMEQFIQTMAEQEKL